MRCATKTLSTLPVRPLAPFCVVVVVFLFFFFCCWMNEWKTSHALILFYLFGHLFTCCVLFFLTFDFFEEFLKKFEVWIFENSTFFCEENVTKSKSLSSSSSRVRWWWFGRLLRGSESQNAFDRWSSLKGRLSKSVRLRRGCCVGGDALVVLVLLVVFSARFFCVCACAFVDRRGKVNKSERKTSWALVRRVATRRKPTRRSRG